MNADAEREIEWLMECYPVRASDLRRIITSAMLFAYADAVKECEKLYKQSKFVNVRSEGSRMARAIEARAK